MALPPGNEEEGKKHYSYIFSNQIALSVCLFVCLNYCSESRIPPSPLLLTFFPTPDFTSFYYLLPILLNTLEHGAGKQSGDYSIQRVKTHSSAHAHFEPSGDGWNCDDCLCEPTDRRLR